MALASLLWSPRTKVCVCVCVNKYVGCIAGSHSSYSNLHAKIYDHHCPLHVSNYVQYFSNGRIAKIGSVKVISILQSLETPESVRLHAATL